MKTKIGDVLLLEDCDGLHEYDGRKGTVLWVSGNGDVWGTWGDEPVNPCFDRYSRIGRREVDEEAVLLMERKAGKARAVSSFMEGLRTAIIHLMKVWLYRNVEEYGIYFHGWATTISNNVSCDVMKSRTESWLDPDDAKSRVESLLTGSKGVNTVKSMVEEIESYDIKFSKRELESEIPNAVAFAKKYTDWAIGELATKPRLSIDEVKAKLKELLSGEEKRR